MHDQPKYQPLEVGRFFDDGRASRPLLAGTVARGHLDEDTQLSTGRVGEEYAETFPFRITRPVLERGRQRFDIFCSPCHDRAGTGQGMIVLRGYRRPPSFHIERLRTAAAGYFFDVISNGFGVMPKYAAQIPTRDRWAIVAYLRALQLSQGANLADLPPQDRYQLSRVQE